MGLQDGATDTGTVMLPSRRREVTVPDLGEKNSKFMDNLLVLPDSRMATVIEEIKDSIKDLHFSST